MILFFSGTGNSRYVAESLAGFIGDEALDVTHRVAKSSTPESFSSQRPYVFVSPTYAWRIPRIFESWLRRMHFTEGRKAYFIMTCGTDIGDAAFYLRKLCGQLGLEYGGTAAVVMPENYIAMFDVPDEAVSERIIRAATNRALPAIEQAILSGEMLRSQKGGMTNWLKSHPVNPLFYAFCVKDRQFRTTGACIGCGKCAKACPLGNITLRQGKPLWGGDCTHCMACICGCPTEAIEYGKASLGKRRYRNELPAAEKKK